MDVFLRLLQPTYVDVFPDQFDVGTNGALHGTLRDANGDLIRNHATARFLAAASNGTIVPVTGTDAQGRFHIPARSLRAGNITWAVRFLGVETDSLLPSEPASAWTRFVADTRLTLDATTAQRDQPVDVRGYLAEVFGDAVAQATVDVRWSDGPWQAATNQGGSLSARLPARNQSGTATLQARFNATEIHRPSTAQAEATIQTPIRLLWDVEATHVDAAGAANRTLSGRLVDDRGTPMPAHRIIVNWTSPTGERISKPIVSDSVGSLLIDRIEHGLAQPGRWQLHGAYAGSPFETRAYANGTLALSFDVAVELDSVPLSLQTGEEAEIRGRIRTAAAPRPLQLRATLGDATPLVFGAESDSAWRASIRMPEASSAQAPLEVTIVDEPFLVAKPATANVSHIGDLAVDLVETRHPDGRRVFEARVVFNATQALAPGVEMILSRRGNQSGQSTYHLVTGENGTAQLQLEPHETGNVTVLAVRGVEAKVSATQLAVNTVPYRVVASTATDLRPYAWSSVTLLLTSFAAAAGAWLWARAHRLTLAKAFRRAWRMLSGGTLPAHATIRQAYQGLRECLKALGYAPKVMPTVRETTAHAIQHFQLPREEMEDLAGLFEIVTYSQQPLPRDARPRALRSFERIAQALIKREAAK